MTFAVQASDNYPLHTREQLKWELWIEGLPEFEQTYQQHDSKIPGDLERLLEKFDL